MNVIMKCSKVTNYDEENGYQEVCLSPLDEDATHGVEHVYIESKHGNFKPGKEYRVNIECWPNEKSVCKP